MFDSIINFFKKFSKENKDSKDTAKERLHLVLMQDRANVSADFLEMMKQEIIEVIKKYIDVDENSIDVKLTNKVNSDGTTGAPALYANIPIMSLKDETKKISIERQKEVKEAEKKKETEKVEQNKDEKQKSENNVNIEEKTEETVEKTTDINEENIKNDKEEKNEETVSITEKDEEQKVEDTDNKEDIKNPEKCQEQEEKSENKGQEE